MLHNLQALAERTPEVCVAVSLRHLVERDEKGEPLYRYARRLSAREALKFVEHAIGAADGPWDLVKVRKRRPRPTADGALPAPAP